MGRQDLELSRIDKPAGLPAVAPFPPSAVPTARHPSEGERAAAETDVIAVAGIHDPEHPMERIIRESTERDP